MTYSIIAEGLVKRYGDTVALDGIDLAVPTLVRPDGGHASVFGHDVVSHAHQVRQLEA
jgi:ABC-type multidrug transport system ATPase subunit